jgi:prepilin-type N-terminal cleavage/methylation domain-containing protein
MLRHSSRRTGFSLTEVIVAMFIMAIGIISLLTLFPVGAVQMGLALRDDRSQSTALQADATLRLWWKQLVVEIPATGEDVPFYVMDDPNDPWNRTAAHGVSTVANPGPPNFTFAVRPAGNTVPPPPAAQLRNFPLAVPTSGLNSEKPSFPVLIDPIGFQSFSSNAAQQFWVAGAGDRPVPGTQFAIPRRTLSITQSFIQSVRTCSLFDDIEFSKEVSGTTLPGYPDPTAGSFPVVRQGRYNWAAVVQRQNNSIRNIADLKILVFDRRAPGIAPSDAELMFTIPAAVGTTQIVLPTTLDVLKLRSNSWIMDGTIDATTGIRNTNFYRIQSVTESGANTIIELQTPIKPPR